LDNQLRQLAVSAAAVQVIVALNCKRDLAGNFIKKAQNKNQQTKKKPI
jgi:hypothetical protein